MSWRRRLAEMLELEPAGVPVPVSVEPDGSVLLHLGSESINLGCLPEGMVDQKVHEVPEVDVGPSLRRLGAELHEVPSKRVLGGAGLTVLFAALFLSHARQHNRRSEPVEKAAA